MADETKPEPAKSTEPAAKKLKKKAASKSGQRRRAKKKPSPNAKVRKSKVARLKTTAKPRPRRKQSTTSERAKILAAADREGLTAPQVQKRFGVKPVTYYSWRKKLGLKGPRGRRPTGAARTQGSDLGAQVRAGVQARVREMLPSIVREEVGHYLDQMLGSRTAAKGHRRR
jgi:hypothetical protein